MPTTQKQNNKLCRHFFSPRHSQSSSVLSITSGSPHQFAKRIRKQRRPPRATDQLPQGGDPPAGARRGAPTPRQEHRVFEERNLEGERRIEEV